MSIVATYLLVTANENFFWDLVARDILPDDCETMFDTAARHRLNQLPFID